LMMRWQNLWCDKFVVARNLVEYAKTTIPKKKLVTNTWVHNLGFNTANCPSIESITTHKVPILVHAPSEQIIKGTKYVRRAINVLKKRGLVFEYKELIGMPNVETQEVYKNSDVIIDQFLLGDIGTLAFEGMGYGKPVVSYVFQSVIDEHMPDCPVWNSNIDDLADRLEEIVLNPELRVSLGAEGVRFVKRHVDYESINRAIIDLYSSL